MMNQDIIIKVIELLGTFAFAISGIRHAAAKHFDWFQEFVMPQPSTSTGLAVMCVVLPLLLVAVRSVM